MNKYTKWHKIRLQLTITTFYMNSLHQSLLYIQKQNFNLAAFRTILFIQINSTKNHTFNRSTTRVQTKII